MTTTAKRKKIQKTKNKNGSDAEFKELVSSLRGSMSWLNTTVDKYLADKRFSDAGEIVKVKQIR